MNFREHRGYINVLHLSAYNLYPSSSLPGRSRRTSANSVAVVSFCNFVIFPKELTHANYTRRFIITMSQPSPDSPRCFALLFRFIVALCIPEKPFPFLLRYAWLRFLFKSANENILLRLDSFEKPYINNSSSCLTGISKHSKTMYKLKHSRFALVFSYIVFECLDIPVKHSLSLFIYYIYFITRKSYNQILTKEFKDF